MVTELALGVEGVKSVDNRLIVSADNPLKDQGEEAISSVLDASISTAIATKLLLNPNIDSSDIDVDTESREVVIMGTVGSEIESDLTEQIAQNTFEVDSVFNRLVVVNE